MESRKAIAFTEGKQLYPAKTGHLTFTLLSSLEVIRMGWPGTHSIDEIAASCAPRIMWRRRPPSFKSHKAICPAEEAEASTGCPSIRQEFEHIKAKERYEWNRPLRNPSALIPPPSMNIRISLSSARIS